GLDYDSHLRAEISEAYKVPSTTAAHAILTAADALGARKVSIVSPYTKEVDQDEHRYFDNVGLEVLGGARLGVSTRFKLGRPQPASASATASNSRSPIPRRCSNSAAKDPTRTPTR